jgi:hypothetical protein
VTGLSRKLGEYRKAVASLVTGSFAWAGVVIASEPAPITAAEWLMLGGVAVAALAVAGVSANDPA